MGVFFQKFECIKFKTDIKSTASVDFRVLNDFQNSERSKSELEKYFFKLDFRWENEAESDAYRGKH